MAVPIACTFAAALIALAPVAARGQTVAPIAVASPASTVAPPVVSGSVTGSGLAGHGLTIRISALDVRGWRDLRTLGVELLSGGRTLDEFLYDVENEALDLGIQRVKIGTGSSGSSEYFRVSGAQVIVTTGGGRLIFSARLDVLKDLPADARFRLTAVDFTGDSSSITRQLTTSPTPSGGVGWGTVAAVVAAALFAGGFLGNLLASRRRPPPRLSVYAAVQRRVEEGRPARSGSGQGEGRA